MVRCTPALRNIPLTFFLRDSFPSVALPFSYTTTNRKNEPLSPSVFYAWSAASSLFLPSLKVAAVLFSFS